MSFQVVDRGGVSPPMLVGDPNTKTSKVNKEYILANNITIPAGGRGPLVYDVRKGTLYVFFASFVGTSPSLQLQYLGDDGVYYNIDTARTTNGAGTVGENVGEGSTVCVLNSGTNQLTNIYAKIS